MKACYHEQRNHATLLSSDLLPIRVSGHEEKVWGLFTCSTCVLRCRFVWPGRSKSFSRKEEATLVTWPAHSPALLRKSWERFTFRKNRFQSPSVFYCSNWRILWNSFTPYCPATTSPFRLRCLVRGFFQNNNSEFVKAVATPMPLCFRQPSNSYTFSSSSSSLQTSTPPASSPRAESTCSVLSHQECPSRCPFAVQDAPLCLSSPPAIPRSVLPRPLCEHFRNFSQVLVHREFIFSPERMTSCHCQLAWLTFRRMQVFQRLSKKFLSR